MKLFRTTVLLLSLLTGRRVLAQEEEETCACAAEERDFTIDCSDMSAMQAACDLLQSNNCASDCSSSLCERNFLIMLAHHDFCLEDELASCVEDDIHDLEEVCEVECEILKKFREGLPDCPEPNCGDSRGDDAFAAMVVGGCADDCSTTTCQSNYRILKGYHDDCEEEDINTTTEQGFHDMAEACEEIEPSVSCNPASASVDGADQLVCGDSTDPTDPATDPACFSKHNTVQVLGKGTIPMDLLAIGDYVLTDDEGTYSQVYSFAHRKADQVGSYLQIETNDNVLEISPIHMMYANGKVVRAMDVQVGDRLNHHQVVTSIQSVVRQGLYAPFTMNGSIQVSGIRASSYVSLWTKEWVAVDSAFQHIVLTPLRLYCMLEGCKNETYNDEGFPTQYAWLVGLWINFGRAKLTTVVLPPTVLAMTMMASRKGNL